MSAISHKITADCNDCGIVFAEYIIKDASDARLK